MLDEELRKLEHEQLAGGAATRVRYATALARVGRLDDALVALRDTIADLPDEDEPRRAYGELVAARDPARADFIRLQLESASLPEHDARREELAVRAEGLLERHRDDWLAALENPATRKDVIFKRGFPDLVVITGAPLLAAGEALLGREPVRELRIYLQEGEPRAIAASPVLRHVRGLDYGHATLSPSGLAALLASPHLAKLERLRVWTSMTAPNAIAREVARAPLVARLRSLEIQAKLTNVGAHALAASPHVARIERLALRALDPVWFTDAGFEAIVRAFVGVRELKVTNAGIGPGAARALAASALELTSLELAGTHGVPGIGPEGASVLARWPGASKLRRLSLSRQNLGPEGALALADSTHLTSLERLELTYDPVGVDAFEALAGSIFLGRAELVTDEKPGYRGRRALLARARPPRELAIATGPAPLELTTPELREILRTGNAAKIRKLSIQFFHGGVAIAEILADSKHLDRLGELHLSGTIGVQAARALAQARRPGLRVLDLGGSDLGDEGARALAEWPALPRLAILNVERCGLGDEGIAALAARLGPELVALHASDNRIGAAGVKKLAHSPAAGSLVRLALSRNPLGDGGIEALARTTTFAALRALELERVGFSALGAQALLGWARLPELGRLVLGQNGVAERDEVVDALGYPQGGRTGDPVIAEIRRILGSRLQIDR